MNHLRAFLWILDSVEIPWQKVKNKLPKPVLNLILYMTKFLLIRFFLGLISNEGLVVSICLGGALVGCLLSGWIADGVGRRRAFQLSALPIIIGASMRLYFQIQ